MQVPRLEKIVVHGRRGAVPSRRFSRPPSATGQITGQKPSSPGHEVVAGFNSVRQRLGAMAPCGATHVEFLDRLISLAYPSPASATFLGRPSARLAGTTTFASPIR